MASNSRIYKTISGDDIRKIVKNIFNNDIEVASFKILKGGLFNTTYFIKTYKPQKALVLRVGPFRKELLFNFEKNMMAKEPAVYKLFQNNDIPAPKVIAFDNTYNIIDRDYIITEYIKGISLNDPAFPRKYKDKIQYGLGFYTSKIHSIKSNAFGWVNDDEDTGHKVQYDDLISYENCKTWALNELKEVELWIK